MKMAVRNQPNPPFPVFFANTAIIMARIREKNASNRSRTQYGTKFLDRGARKVVIDFEACIGASEDDIDLYAYFGLTIMKSILSVATRREHRSGARILVAAAVC